VDWSQIAAILGVLGFVLALPIALLRAFDWLKEPTFQALQGTLHIQHREEPKPLDFLWDATFTIAGFGGARTRRIVEWYWIIGYPENPKVGGGQAKPLNVLLPAKETVTFDLSVDQVGMSEEPDREQIEAVIFLHVDRYWDSFRFLLQKTPKNEFVVDYLSTTLNLFGRHFTKQPFVRRLRDQIVRRIR
jgi:hypothetical protein